MSNESGQQPGPSGLGQQRDDETDDDENEDELEDDLMQSLPRPTGPITATGGPAQQPQQSLAQQTGLPALPGIDPNLQLQNLQMQHLQHQQQQQQIQQLQQQHQQQSAAMSANPFMPGGMQGNGFIYFRFKLLLFLEIFFIKPMYSAPIFFAVISRFSASISAKPANAPVAQSIPQWSTKSSSWRCSAGSICTTGCEWTKMSYLWAWICPANEFAVTLSNTYRRKTVHVWRLWKKFFTIGKSEGP